jgi:hypothetical protein
MVLETLGGGFFELNGEMTDSMLLVDNLAHFVQQFVGAGRMPGLKDHVGRESVIALGDAPSVHVVD